MDCYFCKSNIKEIDFKESQVLRRFISGAGKIKPKKRTGICSSHQRKLARAIKRARYLGILSSIAR